MSGPALREELSGLRLERLLDASAAIIAEQGWGRLSMTEVAHRSGVPRQTLYKQVGTKSDLGAAVVHREVARLLDGVRSAIAAHPDSIESGLGAAARFVLVHGKSNAVLHAVVRPGRDPELLKLLALRPEAVLAQASDAVRAAVDGVAEAVVDSTVRLTLSHLLQPTVSVDEAVTRIQTTVRGLLASG